MRINKKPRKHKLILIREPNGRLQRPGKDEQEPAPAAVKRLRDEALAGMADPQWGTQLGRLFLQGRIEPPLYAAGRKWGEYAAKYRDAIGSPTDKPIAFERRGHSYPPDPNSEKGIEQVKKDSDAIMDFITADAALSGWRLSRMAVRTCVENDIAPAGVYEDGWLRHGLKLLAEHWGLTAKEKNVR